MEDYFRKEEQRELATKKTNGILEEAKRNRQEVQENVTKIETAKIKNSEQNLEEQAVEFIESLSQHIFRFGKQEERPEINKAKTKSALEMFDSHNSEPEFLSDDEGNEGNADVTP